MVTKISLMRTNFVKCHGKFDCLVYEMLLIKKLRPSLYTQSDSISAKLFVWLVAYFYVTIFLMNYWFFFCIYRIFTLSLFHLIMTSENVETSCIS